MDTPSTEKGKALGGAGLDGNISSLVLDMLLLRSLVTNKGEMLIMEVDMATKLEVSLRIVSIEMEFKAILLNAITKDSVDGEEKMSKDLSLGLSDILSLRTYKGISKED